MFDFVVNFWEWLTADIPIAPMWVLILGLASGFVLACVPAVWKATRLFATYVHEAGHAVFAMLTGRQVTRIRLEKDTSGTTEHVGTSNWFARVITAFAGYPAPALAGFGFVAAVSAGHPRWVLVGFGVIGLMLLFAQHSWRGLLMTVIIGASIYFISLIGNETASVIIMIVGGYLLAASPRTVIDLHMVRKHAKVQRLTDIHSDADTLSSLTLLPPIVWEFIFMIASVALVVLSVMLIL